MTKAKKDVENRQHDWDSWRNNRGSLWQRHLDGSNSGLEDWNGDWTRSEFDVQHLREAMRRATQVRKLEDHFKEGLAFAKEFGFNFTWQHRHFRDHLDDGYRLSQEEAMIENAPTQRIWKWRDQMPDVEQALASDLHIVDWPDESSRSHLG